MNPFENDEENNIESVLTTDQIIIWKENRGRKINSQLVRTALESSAPEFSCIICHYGDILNV